jgi:Holliday junction DNA helicase RuvA
VIAMLTGRVAHRDGLRAIVDVQGVGYEVFGPGRVLDAWIEAGEPVRAFIATRVREDAITLYAFDDDTERKAFDVLTSVSGVGPKMALSALDTLPLPDLVQAIERDDVKALSRIAGVGGKTAKRIALELKGKMPIAFAPTAAGRPRRPVEQDPLPLALAQLDYGKSEIDRALRALEELGIEPSAPLQSRLQAALRALSGT